MVEIIPALMPKFRREIAVRAGEFAGMAHWMQIDVMDGKFVPERTWPYRAPETGETPDSDDERATFLPTTPGIEIELDLMIHAPEEHIAHWAVSGAHRFIFHIESVRDTERMLDGVRVLRRERGAEVGFAINLSTDIASLDPYAAEAYFLQCMGIARIGYQGEPFDDRAIQRIADLRERYGDIIISVDGGVSLRTAPGLIKAGARRLVVGSALVKIPHEDISAVLAKFQEI